ncbi:MAG: RNA-directed DNA polymerase [Legionella sp.]|uniref:RNA-directed DNA polymerase n=1 Tax=Legionella sp. TaxID=459 RepID=UPI0039E27D9A
MPLGSAASQLFANLYLNPLDHFIKHTLRIKGYIRYMDDLLLLGSSSAQLSEYRTEIKHFLQEKLHLNLHPTKQIIQTTTQGADYLGYKVYPHYLHLRQRSIDKLFAWLRFFNACLDNPPAHRFWIPDAIEWLNILQTQPATPDYFLLQRMQALINSYLGLMKNTQHSRLRKKIYQKHFGLLKRYFLPSDADYSAVRIKKRCLQDWIAAGRTPATHTT